MYTHACLSTYNLSMILQAVKECLENFPNLEQGREVYRKGSRHCKVFLEKVMQTIGESLFLGMLFGTTHLFSFQYGKLETPCIVKIVSITSMCQASGQQKKKVCVKQT